MNIKLSSKEEALKEFEKLSKLKKSEKEITKITFKCEICGKETTKGLLAFSPENMLCRTHLIRKTLIEHYGSLEEAARVNQENGRKTKKEKYGDYGEYWKNKVVSTVKERYGVENPGQMKGHREKCVKTMIQNYGSLEEANKAQAQKGMKTKQERYGENWKSISFKTYCNRLGVENVSQTKMWKDKKLLKSLEFVKRQSEHFNFSIVQKEDSYYLHCNICGNEYKEELNNMTYRCLNCFPIKCNSNEQKTVEVFLKSLGIDVKTNDRTILEGKEIDILAPSKNIGIEFDGLWYHSNIEPNYHLDKTEKAKEKGIELIHIFENEWLFKEDIVKGILKSKLGFYDKKIFARKCEIKEISFSDYEEFCNSNHIQGSSRASIRIGLFYESELVQVMSFSKSRFSKKYEYEMSRECSKIGYLIVGGKSRLLKYFEKNYNPKSLVSYCDKRYFNGNSYLKLGFTQLKDSQPNYFYFVNHEPKLYSRLQFQKHTLKYKLRKFDESKTEIENMLDNDYRIIYDCGNKVFVKYY